MGFERGSFGLVVSRERDCSGVGNILWKLDKINFINSNSKIKVFWNLNLL